MGTFLVSNMAEAHISLIHVLLSGQIRNTPKYAPDH